MGVVFSRIRECCYFVCYGRPYAQPVTRVIGVTENGDWSSRAEAYEAYANFQVRASDIADKNWSSDGDEIEVFDRCYANSPPKRSRRAMESNVVNGD